MKYYLSIFFILAIFFVNNVTAQQVNSGVEVNKAKNKFLKGCADNSDDLYDREQVLTKLVEVLNNSVPDYPSNFPEFRVNKFGEAIGFFIYDITNPQNRSITSSSSKINCIDFVDNHIYHFAPYYDHYSSSHILFLEKGNLKIFKSINCLDSEDNLENVISYLEQKLKNNKDKNEILVRVKNYRKYGSYVLSDYPIRFCKNRFPTNKGKYFVNANDRYEGSDVLWDFSTILNNSIPEYKNYFINGFFADRVKAVGFFIYDLSDPRNKQTSQDEIVYFVKNHVYHFAPIDLPYSFSFIAVLGENDMKIFKAINCEGKGNRLEDVIKYLNEKLINDKNRDEIIERVKNYRKYGVYTSFNGISTPQCEKLEIDK